MEKNFKFTQGKCLACGALIAIIITGEYLPVYCQKCRKEDEDKDSQQHLPGESFVYDYLSRQVTSVSGTMTTATGSGYTEMEYVKTDWNLPHNPI